MQRSRAGSTGPGRKGFPDQRVSLIFLGLVSEGPLYPDNTPWWELALVAFNLLPPTLPQQWHCVPRVLFRKCCAVSLSRANERDQGGRSSCRQY